MRFTDSAYISFGGTPAREIWYESNLVWSLSSYDWITKPLQQGVWSEIVYGPTNTLVVSGPNRYTYSTDNGETWPSYTFPFNPTGGTEVYNAIVWRNGLWIMFEGLLYPPYGTQNFYTSVDILTGWTQSTMAPELTSLVFYDCQYSSFHNRYIAIGSKDARFTNELCGAYSTDGFTWLSAGFLVNGTPVSNNQGFNGNLVEGTQMPNHRLVAIGSAGDNKFGYSDDGGSSWNRGNYDSGNSPLGQNLRSGHTWKHVTYGYDGSVNLPLSGRYVAVSDSGAGSTYQFAYSDDGIGWIGVQYTTPDLKREWNCVTYGNGHFVALGSNGYQAMSKDGINWIAFNNLPVTPTSFADITVANNRFVAVQTFNDGVSDDVIVADFL